LIPHNLPTIGIEEEEAALRVLRSKQISQDKEVELFENEFCEYIGLPHGSAVALSSGTSSLFLALKILNAKEKKVTFPGYVCSALRHAVAMAGGIEKTVDITTNSPNIEMSSIASSDISIIPHMYGLPIQIDNTDNLVIEDCCQALGAKVNNMMVGLQGDVGIFSFYATKLMTSGGQGGMFISKNKDYVDAVKDYREFDYRNDTKNRFNFKMTDLQAAIGREQLKKLPNFLKRREEIFQYYKKAGLDLLDVPEEQLNFLKPVRFRAIIKTSNPNKIIQSLSSIHVKAIIPTEDWELLGPQDSFPNGLKLSHETVSIPIYPSLTNNDLDHILSGIL
jgi:perosamine synthetase